MTTVADYRARLDALTRWCLVDLPLAPAAAAAAGALRPTLGDLLRRALGRAGDGVVDLLDALDAPHDPAACARLARVVGADVLLVVVTARDGAIVRADARACRTADEAGALVSAFLGRPAPPWAAEGGLDVRGADVAPVLACALDGGDLPHGAAFGARPAGGAGDVTLVLPLLALDGRAPVAALAVEPFGAPELPNESSNEAPNGFPHGVPLGGPDAGAPLVFGGVLRPGAAFLDAPALEPAPADDASDDAAYDADPRDAAPRDHARHDAGAALAQDDGADDEDADDASPDDADVFLRAFAFGPLHGGGGAAVPPTAVEENAPEPVAADPNAALERLRARTARAERVPAVIATDDGEAEHLGDAAAWLAEASEQELRALARGGWTGDTAVELALASDDPEIDDVARQARRADAELVVEIDGDAAAAWLRRHRPETAERLAAVL